ncbi:unnamed protein product [Vicia faba]|uniref:FAR1 domain-containing protein n=1 Tax=Vicia faba TaxID=3906 RepID=A0AAV1AN05_VICFA|nr:unnamed protein product [Vicia faba]
MREKWKICSKTLKVKYDDTGSRKYECPFKLRRYCRVDDKWQFNVIFGIHNHALDTKLQGHPIVCRLKPHEKVIISEMSIIKDAPKNILVDLKRKRSQSILNIRQVYNERYQQNMANIGLISEMQ